MKAGLINLGAQLAGVIKRRVLEPGYEVEQFDPDVDSRKLLGCNAIIYSGGPRSVNDPRVQLPDPAIYDMGIPILGICLGHQVVGKQLGGSVVRGARAQYGRSYIDISKQEGLFSGLSSRERVLMSHFDLVDKAPPGFDVYARSDGMIAAMGDPNRRIYTTQFHPELMPITRHGEQMFANFFKIAGFKPAKRRTIEEEIDRCKSVIEVAVGKDRRILHFWSLGTDSTVLGALLPLVVPEDRLEYRFLDTGSMRAGEREDAVYYADLLKFPNFEVMDVADRFHAASGRIKLNDETYMDAGPLWSTVDPEHKRKLFSLEYRRIAMDEMARLSREKGVPAGYYMLSQGTLYPDVIESKDSRNTGGPSATIKSHHNTGEGFENIPRVEPFTILFKYVIRQLAAALGLPDEITYRQPYPGPGAVVRIICCDDDSISDDVVALEKKVSEEASRRGFNAHVLPCRTVGVQGDERGYKHPVIVSGEVDWEEYAQFCLDLPNEFEDINRVIYTRDPLSTDDCLSLTKMLMTPEIKSRWRQADKIMREIAEGYGYHDSRKCSQMPGILAPVGLGKDGLAFVVRMIWTYDFLACIGMMPYKHQPRENPEEFFPEEMFFQMAEEIPKKVPGISRVCLDPSDKPKASVEWE